LGLRQGDGALARPARCQGKVGAEVSARLYVHIAPPSGDCEKERQQVTRRARRTVISLAALVLIGVLGYRYLPFILAHLSPVEAPVSSQQSQQATKIDAPPLENFYRVTKDLYRGAQPDEAGMARLKQLGIKTVVNLRFIHSDRDEIGDLELDYEHISVDPPSTGRVWRWLCIA